MFFTTTEAEGEGWGPVASLSHTSTSSLLVTVPGGTFIVVRFVKCSVVFHLQMFFFLQLCKLYSVQFA